MPHEITTIGVFGLIAAVHYLAEKHFEGKHYNLHWLVWMVHPAVLVTMKDWVVHLLVYSKYAIGVV